MLPHYATQVLIIDCWFTFLIIPLSAERQNRLLACLMERHTCLMIFIFIIFCGFSLYAVVTYRGSVFCRNLSDDDLERYDMKVSKDFPFHEKKNIEVSS